MKAKKLSPIGALDRFATTARADLRFAPLNSLILVGLFVAGLATHLAVHGYSLPAVALALGSALVLAALLQVAQVWEAVVVLGTAETEIATLCKGVLGFSDALLYGRVLPGAALSLVMGNLFYARQALKLPPSSWHRPR